MIQTTIEAMLRQKIGLDANSIGSKAIAYAIEQCRLRCGLPTVEDYYNHLKHSSEELNALIETVVVPETWFFRDREPFVYLKHWIKTEWDQSTLLRVLTAPCSTGEEPYSIAITLLESGLSTKQFQIDAIDISQVALEKAKRATYTKRAFRGETAINPAYFQAVDDRYQARSHIRQTVQFVRKNLLEPHSLLGQQYHIIFCRNLLIYLDESARSQLIKSLDEALSFSGLLFVGSAETLQISFENYQPISHPAAFAYRKVKPPLPIPLKELLVPSPKPKPIPLVASSNLEEAKQLLNRGQLIEAAQRCEAHLAVDRTNANAYLLLGKICQELNQPQQAEQAFQKAIYLNPNFYDALIELAVLKEQQGDISTATRLKARVQRLLNL